VFIAQVFTQASVSFVYAKWIIRMDSFMLFRVASNETGWWYMILRAMQMEEAVNYFKALLLHNVTEYDHLLGNG
jgi:hypothetical protein